MKPDDPKFPDPTALAMDRTILANERTFQAWIRTGLSAFAAGLGVSRFLPGILPLWMLLSISSALILLAIGAFYLAAWRYGHLHMRMTRLEVEATPLWVVRAASISLAALALLSLVGVLQAGLGGAVSP